MSMTFPFIKTKHLVVPIILSAVLLIIGSFYDLDIAKALFVGQNQPMAILFSTIGITLSHLLISFLSGAFFALELKNTTHPWWLKLGILAAALFGVYACVIVSGAYIFDRNGFYNTSLIPISYIIDAVTSTVAALIGIYFGKKNTDSKLCSLFIVCFVVGAIVLLLVTISGKAFFSRPRYREVVVQHPEFYTNWWTRFNPGESVMNDLIENYGKREFQSMPSGHIAPCAVSMLLITLIPFVVPKAKKKILVIYYSTFAFTLVGVLCRMLVGAHFLSDVAVAILFASIFNLLGVMFSKHYCKKALC